MRSVLRLIGLGTEIESSISVLENQEAKNNRILGFGSVPVLNFSCSVLGFICPGLCMHDDIIDSVLTLHADMQSLFFP